MQDNTYLPRNFATLGSLELQPPVLTGYKSKKHNFLIISLRKLGQKSLRIHHDLFSAQLCLWSTVAWLNLPSSFKIVLRKPQPPPWGGVQITRVSLSMVTNSWQGYALLIS